MRESDSGSKKPSLDGDDLDEFVRANHDLIARILASGSPEGRAYALALLAQVADPEDVEQAQQILGEIGELGE